MQLNERSKLSAYLVLLAYSLLLVVFNIQVPSLLGKLASLIPLAVVLLFALYDNVLWYRAVFLRFARRPHVSGTWLGTLTSYRRDADDKPIETEHEIALVIRETFTTASVTLLSEESKSMSSAAHFVSLQKDDYALQYQYRNDPKMGVRHRSPIHSGGCTISVSGKAPTAIEGEYWTARDSRGTFRVDLTSRQHAPSFDEAQEMRGGRA